MLLHHWPSKDTVLFVNGPFKVKLYSDTNTKHNLLFLKKKNSPNSNSFCNTIRFPFTSKVYKLTFQNLLYIKSYEINLITVSSKRYLQWTPNKRINVTQNTRGIRLDIWLSGTSHCTEYGFMGLQPCFTSFGMFRAQVSYFQQGNKKITLLKYQIICLIQLLWPHCGSQ